MKTIHTQPIVFSSRNRKRKWKLSERGYFWIRYGVLTALLATLYFWAR